MKIKIINCTPLISPNATDKIITMYQLKPFKQNIYQQNKQLDGMGNMIVTMYFQ